MSSLQDSIGLKVSFWLDVPISSQGKLHGRVIKMDKDLMIARYEIGSFVDVGDMFDFEAGC